MGRGVIGGPAAQDKPERMDPAQTAALVPSTRDVPAVPGARGVRTLPGVPSTPDVSSPGADDVSPPAAGSSARDIAVRAPRASAASGLSLHPEALEDLRRSGLSDATITEAGLYTPAPGDLPRLLSARLVDKVRHVLVFPYEVAGRGGSWRREDEFVRCKLFPSVSDGQGHTIRYYQRAGTPPRL
jgi:hypothetical protein